MKKQYVFIIMIIIILYISFLIISYTYKEHITNSSIEYIKALTKDVEKKIDSAKKVVEYKTSKVVYFTTEENFNKYTTIEEKKPETVITNDNNEQINVKDFSIWERWMYLLFKKQPEQ